MKDDSKLIEWSRSIVNQLMKNNKDDNYLYSVHINLAPNPLNFDGMDEVSIDIFRENQSTKKISCFFLGQKCCSLEEAVEDLKRLFVALGIVT